MTKQTETAVTVTADLSLDHWGTRTDIVALSRRVQAMLPGGNKLAPEQAMAVAQAAILTDANPFRGEIYGFDYNGKLILVDGYKLLVRWARQQCPYTDRYELLAADEMPAGAIGYRCWILRQDTQPLLRELITAGMDALTAYDIAATSAVGILTEADRTQKNGKPKPPPVGWNWDQVARKRALKNALNLSHGAPSPRQIAADSWRVGNTDTILADWTECTPEMSTAERERLAAMHARQRQRQPDSRDPEEVLAANNGILHGDDGDEL